jgi:hypothetical protein
MNTNSPPDKPYVDLIPIQFKIGKKRYTLASFENAPCNSPNFYPGILIKGLDLKRRGPKTE